MSRQDGAGQPGIPDARQRAEALDVSRSFVVQAPAGSGKTGLLVLRFLALLARVDRPEAVLAITFTRKAAGEMRRRILEALAEADSGREPAHDFEREGFELARAVLARDRELGWELLHSPSRLQVFTIDGFCSRVVASTPLMSRLGSTPRVVDDPEPLYREAVRRTLSGAGRAVVGEKLEVLLERYEMGLDRLEDQLVDMLARREQWREGAIGRHEDTDDRVARLESALEGAVAAEVATIADGAEPSLVDRVHALARASRDVVEGPCAWPTLGDRHRLGGGADSAPAWKQAAALLGKDDGKRLRTRRTANADVHAGDERVKTMLGDLLEDIADLPGDGAARWTGRLRHGALLPTSTTFSADGRAALSAFFAVLRHCLGELWHVFRERREVDYGEIGIGAVAALAPGETLEKLDARLEHILVDEFQDTNVMQCELLRGLTSGWQQGDGRTLFLVGDPMQSIYRFRKAEVGLFLAARSSAGFVENCVLESLALSVNFRSTTTVVDWVGRVFPILLGDRDDATRSLVAFAPASAGPKAGAGPDVEFVLWTSGPGGEKAADADAIEAAGLADLIAAEVRAQRDGERPPRRGRVPVAVLVRSRNHALPLLRALEAAHPDLRLRAPGLDWLADRPSVVELEALTRALVHPGDRLAWLALLRSRLVGLALADIAALVEPDVASAGSSRRTTPIPLLLADETALARTSGDARRRIARLLEVTGAAARDLALRSLDIAVRSAWLRLGGPAGAPALAALEAESFFDVLSSRPAGAAIDLDDLARRLRATEAPVDSDAEADVEIMTMHKAKGLQFDTVVLPALGRGSGRGSAPPLAIETDGTSGRLMLVAPRAARGREDADGDKYDFLAFRESGREANESLRLLYVAATRAERRLVLSSPAGRLTKDGAPSKGSLLAALEPGLPVDAAERRTAAAPASAASRRTLVRLRDGFALSPARSVEDRSVATERPSEPVRIDTETVAGDGLAARIGIAFHAFAERIANDGVGAWPEERVRAERPAIAHVLRSRGVPPAQLDEAAARVERALAATLGDERGRWILAAHAEARSEWELTSWNGRVLTPAQIDRTFVDGGTRWIVDYKTGALDGAADARAIAERCAPYLGQLARYGELLAARDPARPVRLGLFFPEWPDGLRWQDVTDAAAGHRPENRGSGEVRP